jgi:hypothetical protein
MASNDRQAAADDSAAACLLCAPIWVANGYEVPSGLWSYCLIGLGRLVFIGLCVLSFRLMWEFNKGKTSLYFLDFG